MGSRLLNCSESAERGTESTSYHGARNSEREVVFSSALRIPRSALLVRGHLPFQRPEDPIEQQPAECRRVKVLDVAQRRVEDSPALERVCPGHELVFLAIGPNTSSQKRRRRLRQHLVAVQRPL